MAADTRCEQEAPQVMPLTARVVVLNDAAVEPMEDARQASATIPTRSSRIPYVRMVLLRVLLLV